MPRIVPLTKRMPTEWLPGVAELTRTERRVVNLMCAGLTQSEMAEHLNSTENSVRCAAHTAYRKLNVSNQHQLMALIIAALMPEDER